MSNETDAKNGNTSKSKAAVVKATGLGCDVCLRRSKQTAAAKYCPHCEDGLCTECLEHHAASRSTSSHHVIPVEDYNNLPKYVSVVRHRCDVHKGEFEFYCTAHAVACCVDCTKDTHRLCAGLKPLHDVVHNVKTSNELNEIEKNLADIVDNIVKLTKEREENVAKLQTQKNKHTETIRNMRTAINAHLDKLENALLEDLRNAHETKRLEIEKLIERLNDRKKRANAIQEEMKLMKSAASNLQNFIGMRELDRRVQKEGKTLMALQEDENFFQSDINITYSETLSTLTDRVPKFGDLMVETGPKNLNLTLGRRRGSSHIVLPKVSGIEHIKLKLSQKIILNKSQGLDISSCEILQNGKLLFLDWKHEHLLTCNLDGSESKILSDLHGTGPFDMTSLDGEKIAITLRSARMIHIIEYGTGKLVKRLGVDSECYGIDHKEGVLAVRLMNSGVFLGLDLAGKVLSRVRYEGERLRYFAWFMDKIYCTITGQNTVVCLNMKGSEIWTFRNVLLREPFGISVDSNGFVYVAGRGSNNVMVISPDGRQGRVILSDREGIAKPQALYVSKFRRQLLVCNKQNGNAYLYDF